LRQHSRPMTPDERASAKLLSLSRRPMINM
jgi:hypothetical protein